MNGEEIFVNQTLLTIVIPMGYNISAATVKKILYRKPDSTTGFWTAAVDTNNTDLTYDVQGTDLSVAGLWHLQGYVEIGGKKGYGHENTQFVSLPIS